LIRYSAPLGAEVSIDVYDASGRLVDGLHQMGQAGVGSV